MKRKKRGHKKLIIFFVVLILIALIVGGLFAARKILSSINKTDTTYMVKEETYENVISIAGVVSAAHKQTLQALSDGTVMAVYVEQGDTVKKGDAILQLDDSTEQYNLAKHDYEMQTVLITGAMKEYQLMKTQRAALVQKIAERKVVATFDGIIADIDVSVGDSLEAKDEVGTIVDISYLTAEVEIAETDVEKLEVGQSVEFNFPAHDGAVYGSVVSWPAIGEVTSRGATVVKAKLRIDEYPKEILPNFSFSGKINLSPPETYLLVSRYAVAREDGKAFVEDAITGERINVSVTPYGGEYVKVESGLNGGEILKAQSAPRSSGYNKNKNAQGAPRMNGMGGGAGGPPPL